MNQLVGDILLELDRIEDFLPHVAQHAAAVSDWTVGQQIEHVAKATSAFAVTLLRNKEPRDSEQQNEWKDQLLKNGSFPRGIVKAPDITLPQPETDEQALRTLLRKTRIRVDKLADLPSDASADHHYLGHMQRDEALAFMAIHLRHHISIMADIMKAAKQAPAT